MSAERPLVFIGSSKEGLDAANAVQLNLEDIAECVGWHQGVFRLGEGSLESLVKQANNYDFAVLVLTPDDLVESRTAQSKAPRDNVLLELGLFIGRLGRRRTFIVCSRESELKLPSDLAGVTVATFFPPVGGPMQAALGGACTRIAERINAIGSRLRSSDVGAMTLADVTLCDLSSEGRTLLTMASEGDGAIARLTDLSGMQIQIGDRIVNARDNPRDTANWSQAVDDLEANGLIKDRGYEGEIFDLTGDGYKMADKIRGK